MFDQNLKTKFYINHVEREEATGAIKEIYDKFPQEVMVPGMILIKSGNVELTRQNAEELAYFSNMETISNKLLTAIRYIIAVRVKTAHCTNVNGGLLEVMGMTKEMIDSLLENEACDCFSDKENALIPFAVKAAMTPDAVNKQDIDRVKAVGWSDDELLHIVVAAINSLAGVNVFKVFRVKE
ncbi:MAG: hypothetical protein E7198_07025 [Schwartzia succinivorans]|jgi:alkylhydroperoxidase family enzyme|uniref:carboxymuconolactone decarboxylase family protein n=1 Tax=Schwartzia succinivorans TaxID=55507 RepID=UPI0023546323|nr:hypothetical protein [Schwartzia succinivorans]MBE6097535.1 hypothetical protein [Schwartzia succinivorans]